MIILQLTGVVRSETLVCKHGIWNSGGRFGRCRGFAVMIGRSKRFPRHAENQMKLGIRESFWWLFKERLRSRVVNTSITRPECWRRGRRVGTWRLHVRTRVLFQTGSLKGNIPLTAMMIGTADQLFQDTVKALIGHVKP